MFENVKQISMEVKMQPLTRFQFMKHWVKERGHKKSEAEGLWERLKASSCKKKMVDGELAIWIKVEDSHVCSVSQWV